MFHLPPIRLRQTMPPTEPDLLCVRTPNCDLTHEQAKNMLEAQVGTIEILQHDPSYLQNGSSMLHPMVMWIFKPEDRSTSHITKVCMEGIIGYDGEKLRVRRRDDVFMEEYRAHILVKQIKEEQKRRAKAKGPAVVKGNK